MKENIGLVASSLLLLAGLAVLALIGLGVYFAVAGIVGSGAPLWLTILAVALVVFGTAFFAYLGLDNG